jgi:hypothetical protein
MGGKDAFPHPPHHWRPSVWHGVCALLFPLLPLAASAQDAQIDLSGLNFFRRIEETRPYQREAWLQATLVFLIPLAVSIPLSFFQRNMDANVVLAIYLVWPLSLLLYAALSTNFERLAAS